MHLLSKFVFLFTPLVKFFDPTPTLLTTAEGCGLAKVGVMLLNGPGIDLGSNLPLSAARDFTLTPHFPLLASPVDRLKFHKDYLFQP